MSSNRPVSAGDGGVEPDEYAIPLIQDEDALPTSALGGDQPPSKILVASNSVALDMDQSSGANDVQSQLHVEDPLEASEIFPIGNVSNTSISISKSSISLTNNSEKIHNGSDKLSSKQLTAPESDAVISNRGYVPPGRSSAISTPSITSEKQNEPSQTISESIQDAEGPSNSTKSQKGEVELPGYVFNDSHRDSQKATSQKLTPLIIDPTASVVKPMELVSSTNEQHHTTNVDDEEEDGVDWGGMKSTKENKSFRFPIGSMLSPSTKDDPAKALIKLESSMSMMGIVDQDSEEVGDTLHAELQAVVIDSDMPLAMEGLVTNSDEKTHQNYVDSELSRHSSQVLASQQSSMVLETQTSPPPTLSQPTPADAKPISSARKEGNASHNQSFQSTVTGAGSQQDGQVLVFIAHSPMKPVADVINRPDHMVRIGFNDDDDVESLVYNQGMSPLTGVDDTAEDRITLGSVDDLGSLSHPMMETNSMVSEDTSFLDKDMDTPDFPSIIPDPNSRPVTSSSSTKKATQLPVTLNHHILGRQERSLSTKQLQGELRSAATPADVYVNNMQSRLTKRISDLQHEVVKNEEESVSDINGPNGFFRSAKVVEDDVQVIEQSRDQRDSSLLQDEQKAQTQQRTAVSLASVKEVQSLKRQQQLDDNDTGDNTVHDANSNNNSIKAVDNSGKSTPATETPGKKERAVRFAMTENVTLIESVNEPSTAPWGPPPGGVPLDVEDDEEPTMEPIVAAVTLPQQDMVSNVKTEQEENETTAKGTGLE